ncbi:hypothetical protein [Dongia sedimenti]|uniref:Uncharacterized protein n=1 Tax=Dongia sedimenti TaxID=3064282 RepID=A0ABU0YJV1_9PROT|nr:hypothetical protein [Rhodospirillaceae bacterium R-7]
MKATSETRPRPQHLEAKDVAHLVGDLEHATIAAILATGATYAEIEQALKWLGGGHEEPRLNSEGLSPTAEIVYDILLADPAYDEDSDQ